MIIRWLLGLERHKERAAEHLAGLQLKIDDWLKISPRFTSMKGKVVLISGSDYRCFVHVNNLIVAQSLEMILTRHWKEASRTLQSRDS